MDIIKSEWCKNAINTKRIFLNISVTLKTKSNNEPTC